MSRKPNWYYEDKYGEAIAAYRAGASLEEAAAGKPFSSFSVVRAMKRLGIARRRPGSPLKDYASDSRVQDMITRREAGDTLSAIGAVYSVTKQCVHETLRIAASRAS